MKFLIAPANKTGVRLFSSAGSQIDADATGLYNITSDPNLARENLDFTFIDTGVPDANAWAAPSGPVNFSTIIAPSATAGVLTPGGGSANQIPLNCPPGQTQWVPWPVIFTRKLLSVAITFAGTFGGGELVTFQLNRLYANRGPITPAPVILQAAVAGTQTLSAAQLALIAANSANSPLMVPWGQMSSSIGNSQVTATVTIVTD